MTYFVFISIRTKVWRDFSVSSIHFCQRAYMEESCDSVKGNAWKYIDPFLKYSRGFVRKDVLYLSVE